MTSRSRGIYLEVEIANSLSWNRELVKLKSWIHEAEMVNSWSRNREFVKLKSWIHEVNMIENSWSWNREFTKMNSWSWNRKFMKFKSCIHEAEIVNSWIPYVETWIHEVKYVNSWRWNREFMKSKWAYRSFVILPYNFLLEETAADGNKRERRIKTLNTELNGTKEHRYK
jgi:hypothetical protein